MFWDHAAGLYDIFITLKNGKVNKKLCLTVAELIDPTDRVLECACGTGMISEYIAEKCAHLIATDYSEGMLKQTRKKCSRFANMQIESADITELQFADSSFDKVVAANVIHLLPDPQAALNELVRVCRPGGKIVIPTYINRENQGEPSAFVRVVGKLGADFKVQFTYESYQRFFTDCGYTECGFTLISGSMPCAVAVLTKSQYKIPSHREDY